MLYSVISLLFPLLKKKIKVKLAPVIPVRAPTILTEGNNTNSASSTKVSLISVIQLLNGAQFLNATCEAARSGCFIWSGSLPAEAIVLVTAIFPVTEIYALE